MDNNKYINDIDLFKKRINNKHIASITLEQIQNLLRTIREYREYYDPDSPNWIEYIKEFFHLMGFETVFINQRIGFLSEFSNHTSERIIFGVSLPVETFDKVTTWLSWPFLISILARKYQSQFGMLTNGKEICIYDFNLNDYEHNYFKANIENILKDSREESLLTLYAVFSFLKQNNGKTTSFENQTVAGREYPIANYASNYARNASQVKNTDQGKSYTSGSELEQIPSSLIRLSQVYKQIIIHGDNFTTACEVIAQKNRISIQTVRQDCSARIHIKSERFCELIEDKNRLVMHLQRCYPKYRENIERLFI